MDFSRKPCCIHKVLNFAVVSRHKEKDCNVEKKIKNAHGRIFAEFLTMLWESELHD